MNSLTALHINIPLFVILAVALTAGFIALRFYRESDPPLRPPIKYLLIALRSLVLFLIVMVVLNPRISWSERNEIPRRIGVYIDHSGSMGIKTGRENRADSLKQVLSALHESLSDFSLHTRYFNTRLSKSDSLPSFIGGTDFKPLLIDAKKNNWDALILLSDGIRSSGNPPQIGQFPPIFSIGIGALSGAPDLFIERVDYQPRVVQGQEQILRVHLANRAVSSAVVTVRLYAGNDLLSRQRLEIKNADSGQNIRFSYTPSHPGIQSLYFDVTSALKEQDMHNNRFDFVWDVQKSAIRVGLFSTAPNIEHKFFKFALLINKDFEIYSLIAMPGAPFRLAVLDSLDVMVWLDFPTAQTTPARWKKVTDILNHKHPGLIVFFGPHTDLYKMKTVNEIIGLQKTVRRQRAITDLIRLEEPLNPLMDPFQAAQISRIFWLALPPVDSYFDLTANGTNLAALQKLPNHLLWSMNNSKGQKSIIYNGDTFWKAHFSLYDQPQIASGYTRFIQGIVRWAADHKKMQPVMLESDKQKFFPGEEAALAVYIYDVQGRLLPNGLATLMVTKGKQSFQLPLQKDSSGVFKTRYVFNETGLFNLKASGFVDGVAYGTANKKIHVLPFNPEFAHTLQDSSFLRQLARSSGGAYLGLNDIKQLPMLLGQATKKIRLDKELDIRFNTVYLFMIIFLLSAEWIIRKRVKLI